MKIIWMALFPLFSLSYNSPQVNEGFPSKRIPKNLIVMDKKGKLTRLPRAFHLNWRFCIRHVYK